VITGVKQSGVQVGAALLGLLVPLGVLAWGWRPTVLAVGAAWLVFIPVTFRVTSAVAPVPGRARGRLAAAFKEVWPVSLYGLTLGVGSAVILLLPLFTAEVLGFDPVKAGRVAALAAGAAILGRLTWAGRAERRQAFAGTLRLIAFLAIAALAAIAAAPDLPWLIWVGAAGIGLSAGSWNSVGMLATIVTAGPDRAGAATGWVQLGFLTGSGLSSPIFGWLVDRTGSYMPVLAAAATAAAIGSLIITRGAAPLGVKEVKVG
jgi:predicted MFS family arabinose efflux permease